VQAKLQAATLVTATDLLRAALDDANQQVVTLLDRSSITHFNRVMEDIVWVGPTGEWGDLETESQQA
jgi:hypothetical protein